MSLDQNKVVLQPVDMTSPLDRFLNGDDTTGSGSNGNNSASGLGVDPYTQDKLIALANAAIEAGNFDLAMSIAALVDDNISSYASKKSDQKGEGEDAKKEESVANGSSAPAPEDELKPQQSKGKQPAQVQIEVGDDKPKFSQSLANEKFREAYGKVAYEAYLATGEIASAMMIADDWAARNNGAAINAPGKDREPAKSVSSVTMSNPFSSLVKAEDFPKLAVDQLDPFTPSENAVQNVGKRQGHGFAEAKAPGEDHA